MSEQALKTCLSVFFITFSIYPSGILPNILRKQKEQLVDRGSAFPLYAQTIMQATKSPIFGSLRTGSDSEWGFNLTQEEYQKFKIWEKGEIPFYIDIPSFSDKSLRDRIRWFLNEVNIYTKLNFIELPQPPLNFFEKRWVYFVNRRSYLGCYDVSMKNFTLKGVQRVVLGYDCLATSGGLAEIVLALAGVPPQHNAPDRDQYIEILEENIIPEKKYLFKQLGDQDWLFHDFAYDFDSAGHFHQHKHSVNGRATIQLKSAYREKHIGVQKGFSEMDIYKINLLYTYIVKKSATYMPVCRKLFAVEDLNKTPQSSDNLQSLPKPKKYLDAIETAKHKEESDRRNPDNSEVENKSDNDITNNSVDETKKAENNTGILIYCNGPQKPKNGGDLGLFCNSTRYQNKPNLLKSYKDPLSYLSDYQTAE